MLGSGVIGFTQHRLERVWSSRLSMPLRPASSGPPRHWQDQCTAGHPPALIRRADGRVREVGRLGSLLGFLPDVDLADVRFRLFGGDVLLLYTDGATDARPRGSDGSIGPLFGQDGLAAALADCADLDAAGIIARLSGILTGHSGDWASDDTALLALRVPPGTRP